MDRLIRKLELSNYLDDGDRSRLLAISESPYEVARNEDLICEGERANNIFFLLDGFACRYKSVPPAARQTVALLLPGDSSDGHLQALHRMDHSVATLSDCIVVKIPRSTIHELTNSHPRLAQALSWATLVDQSIAREWIANIGQRSADRRMAHLLAEIYLRLSAVGCATPTGFRFPIVQAQLGEMLGLSLVHTNKTLKTLRDAGVAQLVAHHIEIPNILRLNDYCGFNANYLHLERSAGEPKFK